MSKPELDRKETGKKRSIHLDLWEHFKDDKVTVRFECVWFGKSISFDLLFPQSEGLPPPVVPYMSFFSPQERSLLRLCISLQNWGLTPRVTQEM